MERIALQLDESLAVGSGTNFESRCDGCEQPRPALILTTTTCGHFFCTSCLEYLEDILKPTESMPCPKCHYKDVANCLRNGTVPIRTNNPGQDHRESLARSMYFNDVGFSTKMNALVEDIRDGMRELKR